MRPTPAALHGAPANACMHPRVPLLTQHRPLSNCLSPVSPRRTAVWCCHAPHSCRSCCSSQGVHVQVLQSLGLVQRHTHELHCGGLVEVACTGVQQGLLPVEPGGVSTEARGHLSTA